MLEYVVTLRSPKVIFQAPLDMHFTTTTRQTEEPWTYGLLDVCTSGSEGHTFPKRRVILAFFEAFLGVFSEQLVHTPNTTKPADTGLVLAGVKMLVLAVLLR